MYRGTIAVNTSRMIENCPRHHTGSPQQDLLRGRCRRHHEAGCSTCVLQHKEMRNLTVKPRVVLIEGPCFEGAQDRRTHWSAEKGSGN